MGEEHDWVAAYEATEDVAQYMATEIMPSANAVLQQLEQDGLPQDEREPVEYVEKARTYLLQTEMREEVDELYESLEDAPVPYDGLSDHGLLDEAVTQATAADIRTTIGATLEDDDETAERRSGVADDYEELVDRVIDYRERFETAYEAALEREEEREERVAAPAD